MSMNFLSLPSELRNNIYEQLLVLQEPIEFPTHSWYGTHFQLRELTPGLLLTNKTVHHEASSLLYAQNRFDLTRCTSEHVASFFEQIGNNANYIKHICIKFPEFQCLDIHNVALNSDSVRTIAKIQSDCKNLDTLTMTLDSTNDMEHMLDALDSPKVVTEAMSLVDFHFRAISSLQIIVEVYEDGPSDHIRKEMKSYGWIISARQNLEEQDVDWSVGDIGFEDYGYNDSGDDGGDVEYDIDNDSDFWRRAGD